VRELALAHGGIAHAENRPEGGARVGVTLPRVPWPGAREPGVAETGGREPGMREPGMRAG
jgi:hypothetical protein